MVFFEAPPPPAIEGASEEGLLPGWDSAGHMDGGAGLDGNLPNKSQPWGRRSQPPPPPAGDRLGVSPGPFFGPAGRCQQVHVRSAPEEPTQPSAAWGKLIDIDRPTQTFLIATAVGDPFTIGMRCFSRCVEICIVYRGWYCTALGYRVLALCLKTVSVVNGPTIPSFACKQEHFRGCAGRGWGEDGYCQRLIYGFSCGIGKAMPLCVIKGGIF